VQISHREYYSNHGALADGVCPLYVLRVSFKVQFYAKCAVLMKTAQFQAKTFCTSETQILKYNSDTMSFKLKITQLK